MKMGKDKEKENYWKDRVKSLKECKIKKVKKRVRQRTKKDCIIVEGSFSSIHPELKGMVLKATARPEEWEKIESFVLDHPDWFGLEFHSRFANRAVLEIDEKNKPRGKQKKVYHFVNDLKIHAGILYAFFSYWCRKPLQEWPDYLKALVGLAKNDGFLFPLSKAKTKSSKHLLKEIMFGGTKAPYRLTRYCIENVYKEPIKELGLRLFDDPFNFIKNYIHADGRAERFIKFFSSKSPQEVANFAYSMPALNFIFKTLQVL